MNHKENKDMDGEEKAVEGEKVWLYREYDTSRWYGEEAVELFRNKESAEAYLIERVEKFYGMSMDQLKSKREKVRHDESAFTPDFVEILSWGEDPVYFQIDEKTIRIK